MLLSIHVGYYVLVLGTAEEHRDRAWVTNQEFLTNELPRRSNGWRRTCHFEVIDVHKQEHPGSIVPIHRKRQA